MTQPASSDFAESDARSRPLAPWAFSWVARLLEAAAWRPRDRMTIALLLAAWTTWAAYSIVPAAIAGRLTTVDRPLAPPEFRVDLNHASTVELSLLPGIGPSLAERIVAHRNTAPFRYVEGLRAVRGIGPKTMDRLRPHVFVSSQNGATS